MFQSIAQFFESVGAFFERIFAFLQYFKRLSPETANLIVGLLGLLCIVAIVFTLFKSKTQPAIAFIFFPTILAIILVIGGRYSLDNLTSMIKEGFKTTSPTAALFVFSVLYFGTMSDAGMFDKIINGLMKVTFIRNSVIGVCILTVAIALLAHLDGGGASTFCVVVPAMLPIYKKMHMRKTTLLRIAVLGMGVLNLMPWAGPTMRAATVIGEQPNPFWLDNLIYIQIFGIVLAVIHAVLAGFQEKKRGAGLNGKLAREEGEVAMEEAEQQVAANNSELARPKKFWFNLFLTIGVIALLIVGDRIFDLPNYVPFMIGTALALFVNYGMSAKMHKKIINLHSGPALMMCSTLLGAAILMGILTSNLNAAGEVMKVKETMSVDPAIPSVVNCLGGIVAKILPDFLGQNLPLVIGILSVPLALAFDTDSYFYGILPVMIAIGRSFGVEAMPIAIAMVVCRNCATFISPMVPATLLGIGLADVEIKDHIKASFMYVWIFSILCLIFAIIIGKMPI